MTTPTTLHRPALRRDRGLDALASPRLGRHRGDGRRDVRAPFLVLFPPLWLGVLSVNGLMVLGHVLMLLAIAAAMLRRRDDYT
jgi:hypothetical protein